MYNCLDEEGVRKPTFWDLLPFVIYRFIVSSIQQARLRRELARQQKIEQHILDEKERIERQKELGMGSSLNKVSTQAC